MIDQTQKSRLIKQMLEIIYRETGGDPNKTARMWSIGENMGLNRNQTEDLAMELVGEGWVEIKTLSGSLALTEAGLKQAPAPIAPERDDAPLLGYWLVRLEDVLPELDLPPEVRQNLELDLYALKAQKDRTQPLPQVLHGLLAAVRQALTETGRPAVKSVLASLDELLRELNQP